MVEYKTPGEIEAMRAAGAVVGAALTAVRAEAAVGVSLKHLDEVAHTVIKEAGATSPFLNYTPTFAATPFPGVICASVNDAVLHGFPTKYRLREGDLLSVDCGATLDGWTGDSAISFCLGTTSAADAKLLEVTEQALYAAIEASVVGAKLGDVCATIGSYARQAGFGLHTDFGGHGVGRTMHEDGPHVPNDGRPGRGLRLRPGLTMAIEPWFMAGGLDEYKIDDDGWTIRSTDGSRGAHFEHTIAVTEDGPVILTARPDQG